MKSITNPYSGAVTTFTPVEGRDHPWEQTSAPTVPVLQSWAIQNLAQVEGFLTKGHKGFVITHCDTRNNSTFLLISTADHADSISAEYPEDSSVQACRFFGSKPISWEYFIRLVRERIPVPLKSIEMKVEYRHPENHETNGTYTILVRRADPWI